LSASAEDSKAGATFLLISQLLLSVRLSEIFGMVSALQLITLLPLMESNMPANTGMFFKELSKIAAFDILDIEGWVSIDDFIYEHL